MPDAAPWRERSDGLTLRVRVTPKANRDAIGSIETLSDGTCVLKLRVRAVPAEGAANDAVCRLLAKALRLPIGAVSVSSGASARIKTILIEGDGAELAASLATILEGE
jgi:uncharacterized protein (TIGR00251 family)